MRFAIVGRGSSTYNQNFYNKAAKTLAKRLKILGARSIYPIEYFDDQYSGKKIKIKAENTN